MPDQSASALARHIADVNARLDRVERALDAIEDLLEKLWDSATETPERSDVAEEDACH